MTLVPPLLTNTKADIRATRRCTSSRVSRQRCQNFPCIGLLQRRSFLKQTNHSWDRTMLPRGDRLPVSPNKGRDK